MSILWAAVGLTGVLAFQEPVKEGVYFPTLPFPLLGEDETASIKDFEGRKVLLIQFASW